MLSSIVFLCILINMKDKLKKVKEILEKSIDDSAKKDIYLGQALGMIDALIMDSDKTETSILPIPNAVQKHISSRDQVMMDAVNRHKEVHKELSKDSITQKNTQFEKLI